MEATTRAPYTLTNYALGLGFRTRDKTDFDQQKMWDEWGALMDTQEGLDTESKKRAFQNFHDRWPWAEEVQMSRAFDPWQRLQDFTFMVLDRVPPGRAASAAYSSLPYDKFKATGYKFDETWTPEEVQAFQQSLEQLAKQYDVPTPDMVQEFEAAKWANAQKQSIIVAAVQAQGYPMTWELYQQGNQEYNKIPETDKAGRRAFLDANPWLKLAWDANTAVKQQGLEGLSPDQFNALMQKYYNASGVSDYDKKRAEAVKQFGADILKLADDYTRLPEGDARRQWRQQNPDAYARLKQYWDFVYGPQTGTGNGAPVYRGGGGGSTRRSSVSQVPPLPAPLSAQPPSPGPVARGGDVTGYAATDFNAAVSAGRARDSAFDPLIKALFGGNIFTLAAQYLALDTAGRDAWRAAHGDLWAILERFLRWLLRQGPQPAAYRRQLASIPAGTPTPPPVTPLTGGV